MSATDIQLRILKGRILTAEQKASTGCVLQTVQD